MGTPPASPVERRNFRLNLFNGVMFMGANDSVASPDLVMTAFAAHLTSNPLILGLFSPLPGAMWSLPQLFLISRLQRAQRVLPIYRLSIMLRFFVWLTLILVTFLVRNNTVLLVTVILFTIVLGLASGIAGLPFIEVTGKTISPRRRGLLFNLRQTMAAPVAIAGAQLVVLLTDSPISPTFPISYGLVFMVAATLHMIGGITFFFTKEPPAPSSLDQPVSPSLAVLRTIWHSDSNYRHYVQGRTLLVFSNMVTGLVLIYAHQELGVRLKMAGTYLLVITIFKPITSFIAGRLSLRLGSQVPVVTGQLIQTAAWGLILLAAPLGVYGRTAELYFFAVYGLISIQQGLTFSNLLPLGLNITPRGDRALYMGTLNTWVGILAVISAFNGVIVAITGFEALFLLTTLLAVLSAWQFHQLHEQFDVA